MANLEQNDTIPVPDTIRRIASWFLMIRCVRNNLFHGGKFPSIPISDPSRDRDLLLSSMVILNAALDLDSTVRKAFEQGIHE
ncbi:MAG TPA: hypothetical protein VKW78_11340 [Terriglobales bacterium]|nr:hypothetical protein [Terriglobales bacterium]